VSTRLAAYSLQPKESLHKFCIRSLID
jgi:hypothetical protein